MLDAEVRIGELMKQVPKAKNQYQSATDSGVASTKREVIENAGFTPKQVERFETLASHPDIVEQVKAEARESDDIVTRSAVLNTYLTVIRSRPDGGLFFAQGGGGLPFLVKV